MMRGWLRPRTGRWGAGTAAVLFAATVGASMGTLSASTSLAAPAGSAGTADQAVIVILKDQLPDTPADAGHMADRRSRTGSAQRSVMGHLGGTKPSKVRSYSAVNGFAATVTAAQADALAAD